MKSRHFMNLSNSKSLLSLEMSKIVDVTDLLEFEKFRVYLECGHSILYDGTVDSLEEYTENTELICNECKEKNNEC